MTRDGDFRRQSTHENCSRQSGLVAQRPNFALHRDRRSPRLQLVEGFLQIDGVTLFKPSPDGPDRFPSISLASGELNCRYHLGRRCFARNQLTFCPILMTAASSHDLLISSGGRPRASQTILHRQSPSRGTLGCGRANQWGLAK